jgi:hypothetical protein
VRKRERGDGGGRKEKMMREDKGASSSRCRLVPLEFLWRREAEKKRDKRGEVSVVIE